MNFAAKNETDYNVIMLALEFLTGRQQYQATGYTDKQSARSHMPSTQEIGSPNMMVSLFIEMLGCMMFSIRRMKTGTIPLIWYAKNNLLYLWSRTPDANLPHSLRFVNCFSN